MSRNTASLLLLAVSACGVCGSGCSVVGYGVGSVVDSSNRDTAWVEGSSVLRVEHLDTTRILMKDGTRLEGRNLQEAHLPKKMYEERYLEAVESGNLTLPRLYDTVDVRRIPGISAKRTVSGKFLGFGIDTIASEGAVKVMLGSELKTIGLSTVESIKDRHGREWEGRTLNEHVEQIPLDCAIQLNLAGGDTLLAVSEIDSVLAPGKSGWRWVGLGIGATVDAVAIGYLIYYLAHPLHFEFSLYGGSSK